METSNASDAEVSSTARKKSSFGAKEHVARLEASVHSTGSSDPLDRKQQSTRSEAVVHSPEAVIRRSEAVMRTVGSTASAVGSHAEADWKKDVGGWEGPTLPAEAVLLPSGTSECDEDD